MKTNRIILAALFILAAVSCQKESFAGMENPRETESATIVAGEMTKTSLNGNNVCWTSDDVIAVYDNFGYKNEFTIQNAEANYAAFSGEVTVGTTQVYAVYPYQLAGDISGSTISVTIPVDQTSKVGSFAEEHNISVAKGEKTPGVEAIQNVTFKNVASFLKFTVPSYIEDVKSVTFSTSRPIAGAATVDASADTPVAVVGEGGSKSVTMTGSYTAGSQFMFVLSAGEINGFTVTVVTEKATWSISRDVNVTLEPGQYKTLGTLELEQVGVSATAAHTYSGSTLTGTTVNVALMPTATLQYASDLKIEVRNAAGTVVRSASSNTLTSSVTLDATTSTSWPYLPQGTYTVSGSYMLGDVEKNFTSTFTAPAPTFGVTSHAYTSYTKYVSGSTSTANSCNAETIYNITSATAAIADAIMNNSNYSSLKGSYVYKLDGTTTTSAIVGSQSWGEHKVTAAYTFDGTTCEGSVACHITGLPYKEKVPTNSGSYPWSCTQGTVSWNTDGVKMEGAISAQTITSPSFQIPNDTKVTMTVNTTLYTISVAHIYAVPELRCRISGTQVISKDGTKGKKDWKGSSQNTESYTGTGTASLTSSNPKVEIENAYAMASAYVYAKSVSLEYAD